MAERDGYRAKSSRAIALKSKWEQMCQRLVRMGAVCRMWRGAYVVSLPDMVAVVMRVMGRCEEVRSGRAESCCEVVYSQSVSSQSLGERSGLASRGRNEGGSWLPRKGAKPKASPTQRRPQKLPRRLDIALAPIHPPRGRSRVVAQRQYHRRT